MDAIPALRQQHPLNHCLSAPVCWNMRRVSQADPHRLSRSVPVLASCNPHARFPSIEPGFHPAPGSPPAPKLGHLNSLHDN